MIGRRGFAALISTALADVLARTQHHAPAKAVRVPQAGETILYQVTHRRPLPGRFHRCTCRCPIAMSAGSASSVSVRCRFHTCRPV
jgi:hypothetical protein